MNQIQYLIRNNYRIKRNYTIIIINNFGQTGEFWCFAFIFNRCIKNWRSKYSKWNKKPIDGKTQTLLSEFDTYIKLILKKEETENIKREKKVKEIKRERDDAERIRQEEENRRRKEDDERRKR